MNEHQKLKRENGRKNEIERERERDGQKKRFTHKKAREAALLNINRSAISFHYDAFASEKCK